MPDYAASRTSSMIPIFQRPFISEAATVFPRRRKSGPEFNRPFKVQGTSFGVTVRSGKYRSGQGTVPYSN